MANFNQQIAASGNDGSWSEAGYWSPSATIIRLGDASSSDYGRAAWFWYDTEIAAQSLVTSGSLNFIPKGASGTGPYPTLRIRAADEDSPAVPSSITDARTRARTTAFVDWTPAAWGVGVPQASLDLTEVIQEVVSRPGFSGKVLLFVEDANTGNTTLTQQLSIDSFDGVPANTTRLAVTYEPQTVPIATIIGPTTVASSGAIGLTGTGTPTTVGATITDHTWRVISGLGSFNDVDLANPTFTAGAASGTTVVGLVVTDSNGLLSVEDTHTIEVTGGAPVTINSQVAASLDDGSWHNEGVGATSSNGANVTVGDSSSTDNARWGWTRHVLNVPQGAPITAADVTLKSAATSTAFPAVTIVAVDADDGPAYVNRAQYNGLAQTSASTPWTPTVWANGAVYHSPDIAAVIQEIVDRPGWVSGNHVLLFYKVPVDAWVAVNAIKFVTWDAAPADAPILNVTYAAVVATPNAGADQGPVDSMIPINLTAAASSGSPDTYLWTLLEGTGTFSDPEIASPTFLPGATVAGQTCRIGLQVGYGGDVGAAQDVTTVTVRPHTEWIAGGIPVLTRMT